MNNEVSNKTTTTYRYGLASATSRLFSKFFDLVILALLLVAVFYWMFYDETLVIANDTANTTIPAWKIFVYTLVIVLFFFIYFIVIPFLTGGYTPFSKLFKIRIYSIYLNTVRSNKKWLKNLNFRFLKQLLIRELFLWEITVIIFLILGIVAFGYEQQVSDFIYSLIYATSSNVATSSDVIVVLFSAFLSVSGVITLFIIINVAFTSKKRSFHDNISNTVVIKMTDTHTDEKQPTYNIRKKTNIQYGMPGEADPNSIIDIIEDK